MAGVVLVLDDRDLQRALAGIKSALHDMRPLMSEIGEIVVSQAQDSFNNQAAPDGTPWEPSQRAEREGGQTLIDKGVLFNSLGYEAFPDSVSVGTNIVYGAIHQFGGKTGRGRTVEMPSRPFLPDSGELDWGEIDRAMSAHFPGEIQ
jgi:phage virion morphogenesis protein